MERKPLIAILLTAFLVAAAGCASDIRSSGSGFITSYSHTGDALNTVQTAGPEQDILMTAQGPGSRSLILRNRIEGSTMGAKCVMDPQQLFDVMEDEDYIYYFSGHNRCTAFYVIEPPPVYDKPCGVTISKSDPKKIDMAVKILPDKALSIALNSDAKPKLERVETVDTLDPNFRRRSVRFISFEDGLLFLLYKEETGRQGSYSRAQPKISEQIFQFNLAKSKTIEIKGAKLVIIEAAPDRITYKVLKPLPAG